MHHFGPNKIINFRGQKMKYGQFLKMRRPDVLIREMNNGELEAITPEEKLQEEIDQRTAMANLLGYEREEMDEEIAKMNIQDEDIEELSKVLDTTPGFQKVKSALAAQCRLNETAKYDKEVKEMRDKEFDKRKQMREKMDKEEEEKEKKLAEKKKQLNKQTRDKKKMKKMMMEASEDSDEKKDEEQEIHEKLEEKKEEAKKKEELTEKKKQLNKHPQNKKKMRKMMRDSVASNEKKTEMKPTPMTKRIQRLTPMEALKISNDRLTAYWNLLGFEREEVNRMQGWDDDQLILFNENEIYEMFDGQNVDVGELIDAQYELNEAAKYDKKAKERRDRIFANQKLNREKKMGNRKMLGGKVIITCIIGALLAYLFFIFFI